MAETPSRNQKSRKIVEEIREKVENYESNMGNFLSDYNSWAEIFKVRRASDRVDKKDGGDTRPRLTEMFRAVNALASMELRMLTASDPFFYLAPMDVLGDKRSLQVIEDTLVTQLEASEYKRHLFKALVSRNLFGSVFVEEPFELLNLTAHGRKMPATLFRPRSMLQVSFDRSALDLDTSDWVGLSDIMTRNRLKSLAAQDDEDKASIWFKSAVAAAVADKSEPDINSYVQARLNMSGYRSSDEQRNAVEVVTYYGKLDTLGDGLEYVAAIVNRKYLVRFHANTFQHGKRPVRMAHWFEFELEPLGLGLGQLLTPLHKSMDANRRRLQDSIAFDTYGIWIYNRLGGINPNSFKVRPNTIVESDDTNAIKRVESNTPGASQAIKLEEILQNEFRTTSGATSTLQAIITEATASEVSLAQNEAVRNVAIRAELAADQLIRKHLEVMHSNNMQNVVEPFNINVRGRPRRVYPSDLWADVDFRIRVTTDKDFRPERLKKLLEFLQIATSIRNEHPQKFNINIVPVVREIGHMLGVSDSDIIQEQPIGVQSGLSGLAGLEDGGMPMGLPEAASALPTAGLFQTPVGPVLGSL